MRQGQRTRRVTNGSGPCVNAWPRRTPALKVLRMFYADAREALAAALLSQDGDAFEDALLHAYHTGLTADLVPLLSTALKESFHRRHEDVASALQNLRDTRSVDPLFHAATRVLPYAPDDGEIGRAHV